MGKDRSLKDLRRLEAEIAQITQVALSFDSILRDNLGPLSVELEKGRGAALGRDFLSDRFMDSLIAGRMRADAVAGIIGVLADPLRDRLDADFEVALSGAAGDAPLDFAAGALKPSPPSRLRFLTAEEAARRRGLEAIPVPSAAPAPAAPAESAAGNGANGAPRPSNAELPAALNTIPSRPSGGGPAPP